MKNIPTSFYIETTLQQAYDKESKSSVFFLINELCIKAWQNVAFVNSLHWLLDNNCNLNVFSNVFDHMNI